MTSKQQIEATKIANRFIDVNNKNVCVRYYDWTKYTGNRSLKEITGKVDVIGINNDDNLLSGKRKEWPTNICVRILCDDGKVIIFNDNTMYNVSGIKEVKNA